MDQEQDLAQVTARLLSTCCTFILVFISILSDHLATSCAEEKHCLTFNVLMRAGQSSKHLWVYLLQFVFERTDFCKCLVLILDCVVWHSMACSQVQGVVCH